MGSLLRPQGLKGNLPIPMLYKQGVFLSSTLVHAARHGHLGILVKGNYSLCKHTPFLGQSLPLMYLSAPKAVVAPYYHLLASNRLWSPIAHSSTSAITPFLRKEEYATVMR
jgi:hypothetical protein